MLPAAAGRAEVGSMWQVRRHGRAHCRATQLWPASASAAAPPAAVRCPPTFQPKVFGINQFGHSGIEWQQSTLRQLMHRHRCGRRAGGPAARRGSEEPWVRSGATRAAGGQWERRRSRRTRHELGVGPQVQPELAGHGGAQLMAGPPKRALQHQPRGDGPGGLGPSGGAARGEAWQLPASPPCTARRLPSRCRPRCRPTAPGLPSGPGTAPSAQPCRRHLSAGQPPWCAEQPARTPTGGRGTARARHRRAGLSEGRP